MSRPPVSVTAWLPGCPEVRLDHSAVLVDLLRYYPRLAQLAPPALVWTVLAGFYFVLALPLAAQLLAPLWSRGSRPAPAGIGEVI